MLHALVNFPRMETLKDSLSLELFKTCDLAQQGETGSGYRAGDVIAAKYELRKRLATGGMGEVWAARSRTLDVEVAIKLIVNGPVDPVRNRRLLQEARAAARVEHPAVIRTFDSGTSERGDPYLVMELLRGEALCDRLARDRMLVPEHAAAVMLPIARALGTIHAAGIVHRDLKPDNIFLTWLPDDVVQPKLLDFGIAKLDEPEAPRLTQSGAVMGSPCYMSPEQARGEEADARSDLWAFCAVLYRCATGTIPFDGRNVNALLYAIQNEQPKALSSAQGDPFWDIVRRGMEKDPAARFQTADELVAALRRYLLSCGVGEDVSGLSLRRTQTIRSTRVSGLLASAPTESSEMPTFNSTDPSAADFSWIRRRAVTRAASEPPKVTPPGRASVARRAAVAALGLLAFVAACLLGLGQGQGTHGKVLRQADAAAAREASRPRPHVLWLPAESSEHVHEAPRVPQLRPHTSSEGRGRPARARRALGALSDQPSQPAPALPELKDPFR